MKKVIKIIVAVSLILFAKRVFALDSRFDYHYSEWSTKYPSGLQELFIQSEVRYKWYKFENGVINYINEYYATYDEGYDKDEISARTYYRYITNDFVMVDYLNRLVTDEMECWRNYCYRRIANDYTLVETIGKDSNSDDYKDQDMEVVSTEVTPYTVDNIVYYVILLSISLISILLALFYYKKKKKLST